MAADDQKTDTQQTMTDPTTNPTSNPNPGHSNDHWSQPQFDQLFSQITSGQPDQAQTYVAAYFDLAEQTLRTARRVSETWAIGAMREQIVADVTQRVVSSL